MSELLYFGQPATNVGCAALDGSLLWDAQSSRKQAWEAAHAASQASSVVWRKFFLRCAEEAYGANSSRALDELETKLLGAPVTGGTYPKRQRFWRFVVLIARGIIPRDLR